MTERPSRPYILFVNGPNLNRLGTREPSVYGTDTLDDVFTKVQQLAAARNVEVVPFQSNHEGAIIDFLQQYGQSSSGVILNPGALAHYGLSLRDCLADVGCPVVEVHISNVHNRESFRHQLVLSEVVVGQVVGLGTKGYELATRYLLEHVLDNSEEGKE
jgi:3-dehydroquinate dehydratase-2